MNHKPYGRKLAADELQGVVDRQFAGLLKRDAHEAAMRQLCRIVQIVSGASFLERSLRRDELEEIALRASKLSEGVKTELVHAKLEEAT